MKIYHALHASPDAGETIYDTAGRMAFLAGAFDLEVIVEFNGTALTAKRGDTAADIVAHYFNAREAK